MRLLFITSYCDPEHKHAGHVPDWVAAIAHHCQTVDVIALQTGGSLPPNVRYHSLGKDAGVSRLGRWLRFGALLAKLVPQSDAIFCMFSAAFVLASWPLARVFSKPIALWYAHGHIPLDLRLAELLANRIVTSSPHGFQLRSSKVRVVGQGIDTSVFVPAAERSSNVWTISSVGRLTRVKRYEDLVLAAKLLTDKGITNFKVQIVGQPVGSKDEQYKESLETLIRQHNLQQWVELVGAVPFAEILTTYQLSDVVVNLGETGSMDKVVLEAMACGVPVLSANNSYYDLLSRIHKNLILERRRPDQIAERLAWLYSLSEAELEELGMSLRNVVVQEHSLANLVSRIYFELDVMSNNPSLNAKEASQSQG